MPLDILGGIRTLVRQPKDRACSLRTDAASSAYFVHAKRFERRIFSVEPASPRTRIWRVQGPASFHRRDQSRWSEEHSDRKYRERHERQATEDLSPDAWICDLVRAVVEVSQQRTARPR